MVTRAGQVKILDFGLAKQRILAPDSTTAYLTDEGTVLGTAGYMSPEQVRGEAAVHASMATFTHAGIGTVRIRPCFPIRSTMHQRPSRCCTCVIVSAAASNLRRAQPRSTAMMARSE